MKFIPSQLTGVYKTETFLSRIYLCVNSDDVIHQLFLLRNSLFFSSFSKRPPMRARPHFTTPDAEVRPTTTTRTPRSFFLSRARWMDYFPTSTNPDDTPTTHRRSIDRPADAGVRMRSFQTRRRPRARDAIDRYPTPFANDARDAVRRGKTRRNDEGKCNVFLSVASGGFRTRDAARRGRGRRGGDYHRPTSMSRSHAPRAGRRGWMEYFFLKREMDGWMDGFRFVCGSF